MVVVMHIIPASGFCCLGSYSYSYLPGWYCRGVPAYPGSSYITAHETFENMSYPCVAADVHRKHRYEWIHRVIKPEKRMRTRRRNKGYYLIYSRVIVPACCWVNPKNQCVNESTKTYNYWLAPGYPPNSAIRHQNNKQNCIHAFHNNLTFCIFLPILYLPAHFRGQRNIWRMRPFLCQKSPL